MKIVIAAAAVLLLLGPAQGGAAEKPENSPAALEKKLHGAWKGQSACQGDLKLRADGTFDKTNCGPGRINSAGAWRVCWDALPPTLVLTSQTSDDPEIVGTTDEMQLIKLNDQNLAVTDPTSGFLWQYTRAKE